MRKIAGGPAALFAIIDSVPPVDVPMRPLWISILAAVLLLPACKRAPVHARVDAAIGPLLPADSAALAGLRLDRLHGSPFWQRFVEPRRIAALRLFEERTGLDPRRDLWELVWAWRGGSSVVFLRGKFGGLFGLEPRFDAPGVLRRNYKGHYVFERGGLAVLFVQSGVAIAGSVRDVQAVIDARGRADAGPPEALIARVSTLPACDFWLVAQSGAGLRDAAGATLPLRAGPVFDSLLTAQLHALLSDAVSAEAAAEFGNEADARQVRGGLTAALELLKLRPPEPRQAWSEVASSALLRQDGSAVRLSLQVPLDTLAAILGPLTASAPESPLPDSSSPRPR